MLYYDPDDSFERVWKAFWGMVIIICSVFFLLSFGLLLIIGWWIVLPILAVMGCIFLIVFGMITPEKSREAEPPRAKSKAVPTIKKCVMCNLKLKTQDESRYVRGAHEWCDTYY